MVLASSPMVASAQNPNYAGPSTQGGYAGPSSVQTMTVKQLLAEGRDDQHATLQGNLVRHIGGDHYLLKDKTGEMQVEIDAEYFPAGPKITPGAMVELTGKFDKELVGTSTLDVKQMIKVLKR